MHRLKLITYRFAFLSLIGLLFVFVPIRPAAACSGGPPPWNEWLPQLIQRSDVIVVGQYVKLDDANANGIFRVQSYLDGGGPESLVISASDVRSVENSLHVHRNYSDCGLNSLNYLKTSGSSIYFLSRQDDGIYVINHERYFPDTQSTTIIQDENGEVFELSISGLSDQITEQLGHSPQTPNKGAPYPRITPVLLTTITGKHYLLPIDTNDLIPVADEALVDLKQDQYDCSPPPCTVYSPNGQDKIYLRSSESDFHSIGSLLPYLEHNVIGERITFSATSDTYALWDNDEIRLYPLWYPAWGNYFYEGELINAIPAGNSINYPVVWSPDGRTMVYTTDEGLWLWDALTIGYPPTLIVPTESEVPFARYFSPHGRYLAVTEGEKRYNLDLVTRKELPDGYVSPDDRKLLVFDTSATTPTTLEIVFLAPGIRQYEYYPEVKYLDVQWMDNERFIASIIGSSYLGYEQGEPIKDPASGEIIEGVYDAIPHVVDAPFHDVVIYSALETSPQGVSGLRVPYGVSEIQMDSFTFANGPGLIEISEDGYYLSVDGNLVSLESDLSQPIKDAAWLPSAFYFSGQDP